MCDTVCKFESEKWMKHDDLKMYNFDMDIQQIMYDLNLRLRGTIQIHNFEIKTVQKMYNLKLRFKNTI